MELKRGSSKSLTILGWVAIILFVAIYIVELFPRHGRPITLQWIEGVFGTAGLIIVNIVVVLAFLALLPYRRPTKTVWKSHGTFLAFVIALMTEMFGWPLFIFIASPLLDVPKLAPSYFKLIGHWPANFGTAVSISGVILIAIGWKQIHNATGLVTTGIYRYIRHPQYTGIFLFTLGWLLHWPSVLTLILWPILLGAYLWLARLEERQLVEEFGDAYLDYADKTKRFIPLVV
jgi:protein-S-isoprenylcysteine O-methyltransferase Ste14